MIVLNSSHHKEHMVYIKIKTTVLPVNTIHGFWNAFISILLLYSRIDVIPRSFASDKRLNFMIKKTEVISWHLWYFLLLSWIIMQKQVTPQNNILTYWRLSCLSISLEATPCKFRVFSYWRTGYAICSGYGVVSSSDRMHAWWEQHFLSLHVIAKQKFSITMHNVRFYWFSSLKTQGKSASRRDQIIGFTKLEVETVIWPL